MKLRKMQLDTFSKSRIDDFVDRMVNHLWNDLRKQCEAQGLKQEDLEPLVRQGMARAEKYGLTSEGGIRQYLDCMAVLGTDFDHDPKHEWAADILNNSNLTDSQKTDELSWHMLFEVNWEEFSDG